MAKSKWLSVFMSGKKKDKYSLLGQIASDLEFLGGPSRFKRILIFLGKPQFRVLFWHRIAHHFWEKGRPLLYHFANLRMSKFGCYIHPNVTLGRRIKLAHPVGIVMGHGVIVEDDCIIYQNVTLGGDGKIPEYPVLKKGTVVYAGATVLGGCIIGERAVIGANSVVLQDVPPNAVAKGNPAKY
jgi:serine O-acetyltransferase